MFDEEDIHAIAGGAFKRSREGEYCATTSTSSVSADADLASVRISNLERDFGLLAEKNSASTTAKSFHDWFETCMQTVMRDDDVVGVDDLADYDIGRDPRGRMRRSDAENNDAEFAQWKFVTERKMYELKIAKHVVRVSAVLKKKQNDLTVKLNDWIPKIKSMVGSLVNAVTQQSSSGDGGELIRLRDRVNRVNPRISEIEDTLAKLRKVSNQFLTPAPISNAEYAVMSATNSAYRSRSAAYYEMKEWLGSTGADGADALIECADFESMLPKCMAEKIETSLAISDADVSRPHVILGIFRNLLKTERHQFASVYRESLSEIIPVPPPPSLPASAATSSSSGGASTSVLSRVLDAEHRRIREDVIRKSYEMSESVMAVGGVSSPPLAVVEVATSSSAPQQQSLVVTIAALTDDAFGTTPVSQTAFRSFSRLAGANAVHEYLRGVAPTLSQTASQYSATFRRAGDELRAYHLENSKWQAQRMRYTSLNLPSSYPIPDFDARGQDPTAAVSAASSSLLFSSIASNACAGSRINASISSESTVSSELASFFSKKQFLDTENQSDLTLMLVPLIMPNRFAVGCPEWLDIGRSFAHAYRRGNEYTRIGKGLWIEASAQKLLLGRARSWLCSDDALSRCGRTFTRAAASDDCTSEGRSVPFSDRKLASWLFRFDGCGLTFLRESAVNDNDEEDVADGFEPLQRVASQHDIFDAIYSCNHRVSGDDIATQSSILASIHDDVFLARLSGFLYGKVASAVNIEDVVASASMRDDTTSSSTMGDLVGLVAESVILFRSEYLESQHKIYTELTKKFSENATSHKRLTAAAASSSFRELLSSSSSSQQQGGAERRRVGRRPKKASDDASARNPDQEDIDFVAQQREVDRVKILTRQNAERCMDTLSSPEDIAWGFGHEVAAMHLYVNWISSPNGGGRLFQMKKFALQKILSENETLRRLLCRKGGLSSENAVGSLVCELATLRDQTSINLVIAAAINRIATDEYETRSDAVWSEFGSESGAVRVTARTLGSYAASDFPNEYAKWHEDWCHVALHMATTDVEAREAHLGSFGARFLWQMYLCEATSSMTGTSSAKWFKFDTGCHSVRRINGVNELLGDIGKYLGHVVDTVYASTAESMCRVKRKMGALTAIGKVSSDLEPLNTILSSLKGFEEQLKAIRKIINTERGRSSIASAMRSVSLIGNPSFSEVANQEPGFVAFRNGVVDMTASDFCDFFSEERRGASSAAVHHQQPCIVFRAGKLEDCITKTTNLNMPFGGRITDPTSSSLIASSSSRSRDGVYYSDTHPDVVFLMRYLSEIFPDEDMQRYILLDMASFFYGRNSEKLFRVWTGSGNNSKSILVKIIQKVFGDLCFDMPAETLCAKQIRNASAPSPEMAQSDGARIGILAEPSGSMELDMGLVKRRTGGDREFSRNLHDNGSSKTATYKLIFCCNEVPSFATFDDATKRRVVLYVFRSTWDYNAPDDLEQQRAELRFKIDPNFERNVPRLARALAWKLFHVYPEYKRYGLSSTRPESVVRHVDEYWRRNDVYLAFAKECVVRTERDTDILAASTLFTEFQGWFAENHDSGKSLSYPIFKTKMTRREVLGPFHTESGKSWIGYKIASSDAVVAPPISGGGGGDCDENAPLFSSDDYAAAAEAAAAMDAPPPMVAAHFQPSDDEPFLTPRCDDEGEEEKAQTMSHLAQMQAEHLSRRQVIAESSSDLAAREPEIAGSATGGEPEIADKSSEDDEEDDIDDVLQSDSDEDDDDEDDDDATFVASDEEDDEEDTDDDGNRSNSSSSSSSDDENVDGASSSSGDENVGGASSSSDDENVDGASSSSDDENVDGAAGLDDDENVDGAAGPDDGENVDGAAGPDDDDE
jgi:phage/plasmid-associated DNA primase